MEIQNTASGVGKGAFPHLIPFPTPPPRFSPSAAYLARLAPSSQLTMTKLIGRLVKLLGSTTTPEAFPWSQLDYARTIALRQTLASRYAPATANLALSALRSALREAWRLNQMSYENFRRVSDLAHIRGDRLSPRKSVDTGSIDRLLTVTRGDQTLRGRRDLAILSVLYGAGLRRSELTHLDLSHVAGDRLMVYGKGRQWRTTYLGQDAAAALRRTLMIRPRHFNRPGLGFGEDSAALGAEGPEEFPTGQSNDRPLLNNHREAIAAMDFFTVRFQTVESNYTAERAVLAN